MEEWAVAKAHEESGSSDDVADIFGCSASWVRRLIQRQRESGWLEPRPLKLPNNKKLDEPDLERLRQMFASNEKLRRMLAQIERKLQDHDHEQTEKPPIRYDTEAKHP